MTERGFRYDYLTVADDKSVEAVRERIYACPCGDGPWVSLKTGSMYYGNGGNEREQEFLYERGPWVRIAEDADTRFQRAVDASRALRRESETLKDAIAELIGAER